MRRRGRTYREIAAALECSKSGAHGLVRKAEAECRRKAELIPRGPSAGRPRGEEHARELLRRLRYEYDLVADQALDHLEPPELAEHGLAFEAATQELGSLIGEGRSKAGLADASRRAVAAFQAVLALAVECCRPFAEVGADRNAETFAMDLTALTRMISPRSKVVLPEWSHDTGSAPGAICPGARVDPGAREDRDLRIFLACLRGDRTREEIGREFGLGGRQVGRILARWKGRTSTSREEVLLLGRALEDRSRHLIEELQSAPRPSRRIYEEIEAVFQAATVRAEIGTSRSHRPWRVGIDEGTVRTLNLAIRQKMEEGRVDPDLIESITMLVVDSLVPPDLDEDIVQA